jgi:hypothetical protein
MFINENAEYSLLLSILFCHSDFVHAKIDDYELLDFLNPKKPLIRMPA